MIGASGAISGVLGAYIVLFPHSRVLTIVPIVFFIQLLEVPAIVLLGLWFLMQLLSGVGSLGARADVGGVAFWAHVAGFVAGLRLRLRVQAARAAEGRVVGRRPVTSGTTARALGRSGVRMAVGIGAAVCTVAAIAVPLARQAGPAPNPGRTQFERLCARCHGADGRGGEMGPGIVARLALRNDAELSALIRDGLPAKGMPGHPLPDADLRHARRLRPDASAGPRRACPREPDDGRRQHADRRRPQSHRDRRAAARRRRRPAPAAPRRRDVAARHLADRLADLSRRSRRQSLQPARSDRTARPSRGWRRPGCSAARRRQSAGDAGRRRRRDVRHQRQRVLRARRRHPAGASGTTSGRAPRAWPATPPRASTAAWRSTGDRLFMVTDHAHLIALNRFTGDLLWETPMADWRQNYGATSAPLVVGNLVVSGISGGDEGVRGFLAAYDRASGKEVWRFWTVPAPRRAGVRDVGARHVDSRTAAPPRGSPARTIPICRRSTGRPATRAPTTTAPSAQGDNLYSDSILALDPATGRLKWHFQYTPHDLWDWDAQQPPVLVDADLGRAAAQAAAARQPQRLLLRARSHQRRAAAGQAVREEADVGPRDRRRRPAGAQPGPDADRRGPHGVPRGRGRHQLVLDGVQPVDRPLLRAGAREVHRLRAHAGGVARRRVVLRRDDAAGAGEPRPEGAARDRRPDRRDRVGAAADRPGDRRGAARSRRPAASSSSARTAAR